MDKDGRSLVKAEPTRAVASGCSAPDIRRELARQCRPAKLRVAILVRFEEAHPCGTGFA